MYNTIIKKLELITEAWNNFFLESKFCQGYINYTEEVQTNYYGDIFYMFTDTLKSLDEIEGDSKHEMVIMKTVGVMQVLFVQQDLIDELLYIFKLKQSSKEDKEPNRTIRNELIGHPIRRDTKDKTLVSSVIFGRALSHEVIHYVIYSPAKSKYGQDKSYNLKDILENHESYLNKYLNQIIDKINKVLISLKKKVAQVKNMLDKQIQVDKIVIFVEHNFNNFTDSHYLHTSEILAEAIRRREEHPRYENIIALCQSELLGFVLDTNDSIDQVLNGGFQPIGASYCDLSLNDQLTEEIVMPQANYIRSYRYEFGKLFKNHPIFSINFFKGQFAHDNEIQAELKNIDENGNRTIERYGSLEYLRKLLTQRGMY